MHHRNRATTTSLPVTGPETGSALLLAAHPGKGGYIVLSPEFSRASERMSKRRALASRVVVVIVVLVVVIGFVSIAATVG